jgi:hypothetical protein
MERLLFDALIGKKPVRTRRKDSTLSRIDNHLLHLRIHAIEKTTARGYLTGFRDYVRFCHQFKLPLNPTVQTLSRYIAYTSTHIASFSKYLTGAQHFLLPLYPDFAKNRHDAAVLATISGARKLHADPVRRKAPLQVEHLLRYIEAAKTTLAFDDFLFAVMISCCFYACHRAGELAWQDDPTLHDRRKLIKRASLHFHNGRAGYHLPYHKSDRFFQGSDILFSSQSVADPVSMLKDYTTLRDKYFPRHTILFVRQDGSVPTKRWFTKKLSTVVGKEFGGHSARAGGATHYARLGIPGEIIQGIGRWSSGAWKTYIRDNAAVRVELELARLRLH